jgi:uncharacterized protein YukE
VTASLSNSVTTSTTGAGIFDSYHSLVTSIQNDSESEGEKVLDVAISAAGAVADTVAFAMDPLAGLLSAGVGWLFEHVSFLREPMDALLGNPDQIQANVDRLKTYAANVKELADAHSQDMSAFQDWSGQAADNFHGNMDRLGGELASLSKTVEGTATVVAVSGVLVTTLRSIVRDLIAALIAELIEGALIAAASAVFTFGASIAGFIGYAVGRAAALGAKIASKISKLVAGMARQGSRLAKLGAAMGELAKNLGRFAMIAGIGKSVYDAAKPGQPDLDTGSGDGSDGTDGSDGSDGPDRFDGSDGSDSDQAGYRVRQYATAEAGYPAAQQRSADYAQQSHVAADSARRVEMEQPRHVLDDAPLRRVEPVLYRTEAAPAHTLERTEAEPAHYLERTEAHTSPRLLEDAPVQRVEPLLDRTEAEPHARIGVELPPDQARTAFQDFGPRPAE